MKSSIKAGFLLLVTAALALMSACGGNQAKMVEGKVNVITSFYPLYDFTNKIGGEHVNVVNLVPTGVEPHDWTPKSSDMKHLSAAQVFVYNGAGLEGWVGNFLGSLNKNSALQVVEASKGIDLIRAEEQEGHGEDSGHGHEHEELEFNPHVWLSPLQAKNMAENIKHALISADAAHKSDYEANFAQLSARLDALHNKFQNTLGKLPNKNIVVSHDAFAYLAKEYGLKQLPIMGLAPDAEPTAQSMKEIASFVRQNQVKAIFFEELVSDKVAKALAADTGVKTLLVLNPLEGLTEEQEKSGADYFTLMENNLQNLVKGLQ
ncbi:metal ABC transporter substrate-binding protein [Paenibacillus sp. y28]|uniref:metal ABC transporter substrate-binding protein n=1 Tax=Paenibacillus sp. y28 TaxID=3129110 RepID=UPI003019F50B